METKLQLTDKSIWKLKKGLKSLHGHDYTLCTG